VLESHTTMPSQVENRTIVPTAVKDFRAGHDTSASTKWTAWMLRPTVLFVAVYTIVGVLHESAHAVTAYALNVPATIFHVGVNIDRAHGTPFQRVAIGVAGPLPSLPIRLLSCCVVM